ncbi:unnamed protein product [Camellia sinensis]
MAASSSITTFKFSSAVLPIFDGENYDFWSTLMRTFFISEDLWDLVENSYESPQSQEEYSAWSEARKEKLKEHKMKDAKALYYIQQAITKTIAPRIMAATKSKEAWEILKNEFQGSENQLLEQSFQTKMNMSENKDGGNKKQNQGNQFQRGQSNSGHKRGRGGKRHTQWPARGISQSESRCKFCKNTNHGSMDCHFQKCTRCKNPNHLEKDCWFRITDEANFSEKREFPNQQFYPYMNTQQEAQDTWYIDSRCSNHMMGNKSSFVRLDEGEKSKVELGDEKIQNIEGKGTIAVQTKGAMEASTSSEVDFQIPANSRIPLSVPSGDEVESAISRFTSTLQSDTGSEVGSLPLISSVDGLGKLQSVVGMTFQNAFELLGRAKPIQNLLKAVVTDVKMWNAFLNNKAVQEFLRQLETGANNVVTNLSSNQQTDNLSIQQWSSGANNIVRTPSINPQTHNDFFSQQQSSAQQESSMTNALAKILGTVIRFVEPILTAFNFFRDYRGGGGGGGGGGRGRGRGRGHGGGRGGGGPQSEFYNCFLDDEEELTKNYTEVVFVLAIVLKLSIVLMRFHGIRC